jgi:hypothetical protein
VKGLNVLALVIVAALLTVGVASSASTDKGRRIAGPICVNTSTGVVRAVAEKPFQKCRPGEIRRYGLKITAVNKTVIVKGTAGPAGKQGEAGAPGAKGDAGAPGAAGPAGAKGDTGAAGQVTVVQLTGEQANCVRISGSDGSSGVICGSAGAKGDKGDTGATGPAGAPGECKCEPCPPPPPEKPKCNSGNGNGSEGDPDCDPGNSGGNNNGGD